LIETQEKDKHTMKQKIKKTTKAENENKINQSKSNKIMQEIKMKSINVKRRKLYLDNLKICKDILIQQISLHKSTIWKIKSNLPHKI